MKVRCDLNINGDRRRLVLQPQPNETLDNVALKVAGSILFWDDDPKELSVHHPALAGQPFKPDMASLDESGAVSLWVECGRVALYKLDKLSRRFPNARIVVLKAGEAEGRRLRADMDKELDRGNLVQVWAFPSEDFKAWRGAMAEDIHVVGEAEGRTLNLVVNETPIYCELLKF